MTCYFGAKDASEQIALIRSFLPSSSEEENSIPAGSLLLDIYIFNMVTKVFKGDADLCYFSQLIHDIRKTTISCDIEEQALLAFVVLFDHDITTKLSNQSAIFDINSDNQSFLQSYNPSLTVQHLTSSLLKMAVFSSYNISWNDGADSTENIARQVVDIKYTQNEELWILMQVQQVEDAFRSVPIGEEILEEFTMVSLGVPLSKHFLTEVIALGMERAWRVFQTQTEFNDLSTALQCEMKHDRVSSLLATIIARSESFATGTEQLQFAFGQLDQNRWADKFNQVFASSQLQKVGFLKSAMELPVFQLANRSNVTQTILSDASALANDRMIWGIMMLLLVTTPMDDFNSSHPMAILNSQYQFVLSRRLRWLFANKQHRPDWECQSPVEIVAKVLSVIKSITQFGNILRFVLTYMVKKEGSKFS
jgi:hypothetical protein